jgi:broad specificity phosphatase PhoE
MGMPRNIILIRHGESEGNFANSLAKKGDISLFSKDYRDTPGHRWRLTENGVNQAQTTGAWLKENQMSNFFRYYCSTYVRTRETAAQLSLDNAKWVLDSRVRERDWGDIGSIPIMEFVKEYPRNALVKKIDSLYWRPPGGESIADVRLRVRDLFSTLHRECDLEDVIIVTHGEFMRACRAELEYMTDDEWIAENSTPSGKIRNAEILHYTRENPDTKKIEKRITWVRKVCSWDENKGEDNWIKLIRKKYSNDDLLNSIEN